MFVVGVAFVFCTSKLLQDPNLQVHEGSDLRPSFAVGSLSRMLVGQSATVLRPGGTRYGQFFNQGRVAKWLGFCSGCKKGH